MRIFCLESVVISVFSVITTNVCEKKVNAHCSGFTGL